MRQNLPLAMALESAASGQNDKRSRILRGIKKWLVQGYSLSESVKRGYPKCPSRAVAMIAAAEKINQLPYAIKAIETDMVAKADENKRIKTVGALYPVIVISFMFFVVLALMTYVMPQFNCILEEMFEGKSLPAATRFLMRTAGFIAYQFGWLIGLAFVFTIFVVVPVSIRIRFRPRRPDKPYLFSRIGDFIKWHLPVLRWFEKNYSMVQVVEILRLSLNAGCTVNDAIANTLNLDVNNCFKKRLRKWLAKVEAGGSIADSAGESGLGSSLTWAFDTEVNQGNTLAVLETLESFYRSNYNYRVGFIMLMMGPCVTIIMGTMVGFVAYAVFSPMVAIVNLLANSVTP
jgi:type IV pilus assembly protein PilC